jgi:Xaa-Pro aminopeptidase
MAEHGFDGLIANTGPNFYYGTGFMAPLSGSPSFCVLPADPNIEPAMLVATFNERVARHISSQRDIQNYPIWIEIVDVQDIVENRLQRQEKPAQFDFKDIYGRLAGILKEKGLQGKTVGIEKESYSPQSLSYLEEKSPGTRWMDAAGLFWELRSIKTPEEIQILKSAVQITELGIKRMVKERVEGATIGELYYRYKMGVMEGVNKDNAIGFEISRAMISAGDHFATIRTDRIIDFTDMAGGHAQGLRTPERHRGKRVAAAGMGRLRPPRHFLRLDSGSPALYFRSIYRPPFRSGRSHYEPGSFFREIQRRLHPNFHHRSG